MAIENKNHHLPLHLRHLVESKNFAYVENIIEISEQKIVGTYVVKEAQWFFKGHFPSHPITPGVVLIDIMAQFVIGAFGTYHHRKNDHHLSYDLKEVESEFLQGVYPQDVLTIIGDPILRIQQDIRASAKLFREDHLLAASATIIGRITPSIDTNPTRKFGKGCTIARNRIDLNDQLKYP